MSSTTPDARVSARTASSWSIPEMQREVEDIRAQAGGRRLVDDEPPAMTTSGQPPCHLTGDRHRDYAPRRRHRSHRDGHARPRADGACLLMGSVAERVVRIAPCPVLTLRHPEHEFVLPDALRRRRDGLTMKYASSDRCRLPEDRRRHAAAPPRRFRRRLRAPRPPIAMRCARFFHELSPESRRRGFFAMAEPSDALIDRLCDSTRSRAGLTLVACRRCRRRSALDCCRVVHCAPATGVAEVAFAVDDASTARASRRRCSSGSR